MSGCKQKAAVLRAKGEGYVHLHLHASKCASGLWSSSSNIHIFAYQMNCPGLFLNTHAVLLCVTGTAFLILKESSLERA